MMVDVRLDVELEAQRVGAIVPDHGGLAEKTMDGVTDLPSLGFG